MERRSQATEKKALTELLRLLKRQYEAVNRQLMSTLNESDKEPLKLQLQSLDEKIKEVEGQLGKISGGNDAFDESLLIGCDRSKQLTKLQRDLKSHQKDRSRRPFVCIVHGSLAEHPEYFHERLKLDVPESEFGVEELNIRMDFEMVREDPKKAFEDGLVMCMDRKERRLDALRGIIGEKRGLLLLTLRLFPQKRSLFADRLLGSFIQYWNDWPHDLSQGQILVVCLSIRYQARPFKQRPAWWNIGRFYGDRGMEREEDKWRKEIQQLSRLPERPDGYERVSVAVIPELDPVPREEALTWATESPATKYNLEDEVIKLYGRRESVSFNEFYKHFEKLIRRSRLTR